uniref:Sema domain-containing protein n=1 Tax=Tetranychus urticae TaxID=32264 RepID=A0A158P4U7_TETUR
MLHRLLIWIFQFCLLIELTYSFRTFKHNTAFYYKTHDSVFLTNPTNHTTSYGIYVAGKTITIDIPTSVVNVSDILNWKVVNINKERLMFVHKNKPYILINREIIGEMEYSGELSDSIIAFGDNEALHVPKIFNPNLTEPVHTWNFIELLYFDDKNEKVSVIRCLPWFIEDQWKYFPEWKMTDYIHFDSKLYLLIKGTIIAKDNPQSVTQKISIIQLCIDQGSELISGLVEVGFIPLELETNQIIDLIFVFIFGPLGNEKDRYQLHSTQLQPNNTKIYQIYSISDIVALFEETLIETCGSGSRSQVNKCKTTSYESCLASKNVGVNVTGYKNILDTTLYSVANELHKLQFFTLPHPFYQGTLMMHTKPVIFTYVCEYASTPLNCKNLLNLAETFTQANFHINKHPLGVLYVTEGTNKIIFIPIEVCSNLKNCTQCIMYGFYLGCIWSNSMCTRDDQPKNKTALTVNYCFKIIQISPLVFKPSLPTRLTIKLDKPLNKKDQEQLVIQAGDNRCTDITSNEVFINCSMHLTRSGHFKIDVSLRNDRYADTVVISAVSTKKIYIVVSRGPYTIVMLFLIFFISTTLLLITYTNYNKKHGNEFLEFKRSTRIMKIASKSMKSKKFSLSRKSSTMMKKLTHSR